MGEYHTVVLTKEQAHFLNELLYDIIKDMLHDDADDSPEGRETIDTCTDIRDSLGIRQ